MAREARGSGVWRTDAPPPDWYYGPVSDFIGPSLWGVPTDVFVPILLVALVLAWVGWVSGRACDR